MNVKHFKQTGKISSTFTSLSLPNDPVAHLRAAYIPMFCSELVPRVTDTPPRAALSCECLLVYDNRRCN